MINHIGTIWIETERLILRKFAESDIENSYKNWAGDKLAISFVDCPVLETLEEVKDFILEIMSGYYFENYYCFAIELKETKEVIGSIQLYDINDYTKKSDIGFILGSKFWGKGYMTEALNTILNFAFKQVNLHRIVGLCQPENLASEKLMLKCNMQFEGIGRKAIFINENYYDGKIFAILHEEHEKI